MADEIYPPPEWSVYKELPKEVRRTVLRSFQARKNGIQGSNKNLDNAYWSPPHPEYFWDCLDKISDEVLNMIVIIYERIVNLDPSFWLHIEWIKNIFVCSSAGFACTYNQRHEMTTAFDNLPQTCRDTWIGGAQHRSSTCWREISRDGWALHLLLGNSGPDGDQIHIDWVGPADGRAKESLYCTYSINALPHLVQVNVTEVGEPSPFVFVNKEIQEARDFVRRSADSILIDRLNKEQMDWERDHRRLACQGRRGWDEGNVRWRRIVDIRKEAEQLLCGTSENDYPSPGTY